jgi:hypothetical protein
VSEIVLQAGESANIVVMHSDATMSQVKIDVDEGGTWGVVIDPNPAVPYSIVEPTQ